MSIFKSHPRFIYHRDSYNGHFDSAIVTNKDQKRKQNLGGNEFELPEFLY